MEKNKLISIIKEELKKKLNENYNAFPNLNEEEMLTDQPDIQYDLDDQIGNFWIVKKAMKESTEEDLIQETNIFELAEMISLQQVSKADIHGIYKMENKARRASTSRIRERDKDIRETVKEGDGTRSKLEQSIQDIKLDIEGITQTGVENPGQRDSISSKLDPLYAKLSRQEDLLKRLNASLDKEKAETKKIKENNKKNG